MASIVKRIRRFWHLLMESRADIVDPYRDDRGQ
jgi:hypothetical protein